MKHHPCGNLTKNWPTECVAKIEARVSSLLAELDQQEPERASAEAIALGGLLHRSPVRTRYAKMASHRIANA